MTSQRSALESSNADEARAANEGRAGRSEAAKRDSIRQALEALRNSNPDVATYLDENAVDANEYMAGERDYNWRDMVDDNEAVRFERLLGSLGSSDAVLKGRGTSGPGFDLAGYQGALLKKAQGRSEEIKAKAVEEEAAAAALAAAAPPPPTPPAGITGRDFLDKAIGVPANDWRTSAWANILGAPVLRTTNEIDKKYNPIAPMTDAFVDNNTGGDTKKILKKMGLGGRK